MKTLLTSIALLLLASSFLQTSMAGSVFCDSNCGRRCSNTEKKDSCLKYCGICCATCHCVPSGTYGNKDECPCYRDMLSKKKKTPKYP